MSSFELSRLLLPFTDSHALDNPVDHGEISAFKPTHCDITYFDFLISVPNEEDVASVERRFH